jgi:hypothetical protein
MSAGSLGPGDRVRDYSGAEGVVMDSHPVRSSKHAPGKLFFLLRLDDGRVVRMNVNETDIVEVV